MVRRLRVGVIGVGRAWRSRYRAALAALHSLYEVRAVTDPNPHRARSAARRLNCPAAAGVLELLDRSPEAVLVLGRPWYGLWAAAQACRRGLPVFCGPAAPDDPDAGAVVRLAQDRGLPVMTDLSPRLAPAAERLAGLLPQLGTPRLLTATAGRRGEAGLQTAVALTDWCAAVVGRAPVTARPAHLSAAGHAGWLLDFGHGQAAQVMTWRAMVGPARWGLRVVADAGTASVRLPGRVAWRSGDGRHVHELPPGRPAAEAGLERFHAAVTAGGPAVPGLADAVRALGWLRSGGA